MNPGPYITMIPVHLDLETKAYNAAFLRMQYKGPRKLGIHMAPRHNFEIVRRHDAKNLPTPTVVVITHHPAFSLAASNQAPFDSDDYEVMGSIMGEPMRLTPSETWGESFMVPADADLIIEGEIPANYREAEGPFGEYTGYFGPQLYRPIIEVKAITHCNNAIYHDVTTVPENQVIAAVTMEGSFYSKIKAVIPTVKSLHFPNSGCGRLNCYISIDQAFEGQAKHAASLAATLINLVKNVIVVDSDIDPFNEEQVLFAVATRMQPAQDVDIIKNITGNNLDPSVPGELMGSKMIIDATKPFGRPFEELLAVPKEAMDRIKPLLQKKGLI